MHDDGKETVLVLRVNALVEIENTRATVDHIATRFPGAHLITVTAPNAEGIRVLRQDSRFATIHEYPTAGPATIRGFRELARSLKPDATVVCVGATPGLPYPRQFMSALLSPGKKYVVFGSGEPKRLTPFVAAAFALQTLSALRRLTWSRFVKTAQRVLWRIPSLPRELFRLLLRTDKRQGQFAIFDKPLRRILWIRLDHYGDLIMNLPAIVAIKDHYGDDVEIDALVMPYSSLVIQGQPELSRIFTYNLAARDLGGQGRQSLVGKLMTIAKLRMRRYDLAIEFRGDDVARQLAYLSGSQYRLGPRQSRYEPYPDNLSFLMTHPAQMTDGDIPSYLYNLQLLRKAGLTADEKTYRYHVPNESRDRVRDQLAEIGISDGFAVIHTCASKPYRNWLPERFAKVADYLAGQGYRILLSGGPKDSAYNQTIIEVATRPDQIVDVAGRFRVPDLAAFFERAALMVSVDTGPMHIAASVGIPIVSIFVPWMVEWHHPFGQRDSVVYPSGFPMNQKGRSGLIEMAHNNMLFPLHKVPAEAVIEAIKAKLRVKSEE
jgi:heptosyltransferase-3